jgi:hypothetical protein
MENAAQRLDEYTRMFNGLRLISSDPEQLPERLIERLASEVAGVTSTLATVELFGSYEKNGEEWLRFQVACSYFYLFLIEVSLDAVDCTLSEKNLQLFREKVATRVYVRQYAEHEKASGMLEYFLSFYTSNLNLWYDKASVASDSEHLIDTFCQWVSESCSVDVDSQRLGNNLKTMWEKKIVPAMTSFINK